MTAASFCAWRPFQLFFPAWFTHSFNRNSDIDGDDENDDLDDDEDDDDVEEEEEGEEEDEGYSYYLEWQQWVF